MASTTPIGSEGTRRASFLRSLGRYRRDRRGAAAIELALLLPFMAVAFMAMVDLGDAINAKYDIERKMRLAIEGVERYGTDTNAVVAFANADGNAAFSGQNNAPVSNATLTVTPFYICRMSDGTVTEFTSSSTATCPDYESWYSIGASSTVTGIYGKTYNLSTSADLLVD